MMKNDLYRRLIKDETTGRWWNKLLSEDPKTYEVERKGYDITGYDFNETGIEELRKTHRIFETVIEDHNFACYKRLILGGYYNAWHIRTLTNNKGCCIDKIEFNILTTERELKINLRIMTDKREGTVIRLNVDYDEGTTTYRTLEEGIVKRKAVDNIILIKGLTNSTDGTEFTKLLQQELSNALSYFEITPVKTITDVILPSIMHAHRTINRAKNKYREKVKESYKYED